MKESKNRTFWFHRSDLRNRLESTSRGVASRYRVVIAATPEELLDRTAGGTAYCDHRGRRIFVNPLSLYRGGPVSEEGFRSLVVEAKSPEVREWEAWRVKDPGTRDGPEEPYASWRESDLDPVLTDFYTYVKWRNGISTVDEWAWALYLIFHERLHERFTDLPDVLRNRASHQHFEIWNILEDERIERLGGLTWSRVASVIEFAHRLELSLHGDRFRRDIASTSPRHALLNALLYTRFALRTREVSSFRDVGDLLHESFREPWEKIRTVALRAWNEARTSEDVWYAAEEILNVLRATKSPEPESGLNLVVILPPSGRDADEEEPEEEESEERDTPFAPVEAEGAEREDSDSEDSEPEEEEPEEEYDEDEPVILDLRDLPSMENPEAEDRSPDLGEQEAPPVTGDEDEVLGTGGGDLDEGGYGGSEACSPQNWFPFLYAPVVRDGAIRIRKAFHVEREPDRKWNRPSGTRGKLDARRYRRNPDRPFIARSREPADPPETRVEVLVDHSGSMGWSGGESGLSRIHYAREACVMLVEALKDVPNVTLAIYGHPSGDLIASTDDLSGDENLARAAGIEANAGTTYARTIRRSVQRLSSCGAERKVIFVIGDGDTDGTDLRDSRQHVGEGREAGILIKGIGIGSAEVEKLKRIFGKEDFVMLPETADLVPLLEKWVEALGDVYTKAVLR